MQTSIQIIEEIKSDAASLQRKLLTLSGASEDRNHFRSVSRKQQNAIIQAQDGLSGWRGWDLGQLEKAFSEEG